MACRFAVVTCVAVLAACSSESTNVTSTGGQGGAAGQSPGGEGSGGSGGSTTGGAAGAGGDGGSTTGGAAGAGGSGGSTTGGAAGAAGAGGSAGAASCSDTSQNGDETDVDCGGSCPACADTKGCLAATDCQSKVCDATAKTCTAPTCNDSTQNGSETDQDCGGSCSAKCADTKKCSVAADCQSNVCDPTAKTCTAPTCSDGTQNGSETDQDCGGSCTNKCADTKKCGVAADCQSNVCDSTAKTCTAPTCNDGTQNGSETDQDCGGSCTNKCADTKKCLVGGDCVSGVCDPTAKTCTKASCSDGVKNASETDVDCGGGTCPVCAWGKSCAADADCNAANGVCTAGKCWPVPIGVWEQRLPAHQPPKRFGASVAYDQNLKSVVVFGGDSSACSGSLRNDLWAWDGSDWSDVTPTTNPPARYAASLAFDEVAGELVVFGGATGATTFLEDTWGFTSASGWQSRATSAGGARSWAGLAFHGTGTSGKLTTFGGYAYSVYYADTESWSGSAWTNLAPSFPPTQRMGACFEYDSARNRTVMFGGTSNINAVTTESSETWEWDGSSWSKKSPTTSPSARYWASCAYDSVRHRTVVSFGMGSGHQYDTWEWDGTRWLRTLNPATWWKNSSFADTMVFDPVRRRSVWFNDGYQSACANETYEYYAIGTPCAAPTDCAVGTFCTDGLCSKQGSCGTCEATNTLDKPGECAPVLNADDPDTCTGTKTCNASGQCI